MGTQINNYNARLGFDTAKDILLANGLDPQRAVLSQSVIRSEVAMSLTLANYHVPILNNDTQNGAQFNTEIRLDLQDVFVVSQLGLFVAKPSSAADAGFEIFPYPTLKQFSTAGTSAALLGAYSNGQFQLIVDNKQILPQWDLFRHLRVPNQQSVTNAYYTTSGITLLDEVDGASDGFYPVEPNFILSGNSKFSWSIVLPQALAAIEANSRFVVLIRGIKAQNVTRLSN